LDATYQKQFQIRSYEVDARGKIKLATILNYLQDIASEHAARLGASVIDLFPRNLTWVLSRYHIEIFDYPSWGQTIQINTWPSAKINLFALREFEILNENNEKLAIATSSWMLLDFKRKQPVRPADHLNKYPHRGDRVIPDDFESIQVIEKVDMELPFRVRISDLDLNQHVNHVAYIEWALETLPADILKMHQPIKLEIAFRGEAFYGDRVLSRTQLLNDDQQPCFLHQILREEDNKELTRLRSKWRKYS
jgi:medium-chain acyl-[acyl-carrier-protein] hydrolase